MSSKLFHRGFDTRPRGELNSIGFCQSMEFVKPSRRASYVARLSRRARILREAWERIPTLGGVQ